jgi:hypothetical protein
VITGEGSKVNDPGVALEQVLGDNGEVELLLVVVVLDGNVGLGRSDSGSTNGVEDTNARVVGGQSVTNYITYISANTTKNKSVKLTLQLVTAEDLFGILSVDKLHVDVDIEVVRKGELGESDVDLIDRGRAY